MNVPYSELCDRCNFGTRISSAVTRGQAPRQQVVDNKKTLSRAHKHAAWKRQQGRDARRIQLVVFLLLLQDTRDKVSICEHAVRTQASRPTNVRQNHFLQARAQMNNPLSPSTAGMRTFGQFPFIVLSLRSLDQGNFTTAQCKYTGLLTSAPIFDRGKQQYVWTP